MQIKFFIPSDQRIPTQLRLVVFQWETYDAIHVYYNRLPDRFAYRFTVYTQDENAAADIVEKIAQIMVNQSYDHGASWRIRTITQVPDDSVMSYTYDVDFRFRDAG